MFEKAREVGIELETIYMSTTDEEVTSAKTFKPE